MDVNTGNIGLLVSLVGRVVSRIPTEVHAMIIVVGNTGAHKDARKWRWIVAVAVQWIVSWFLFFSN